MDFSVLLANLRDVAEKYKGQTTDKQTATSAYVDMFVQMLMKAQKMTDDYEDHITMMWVALNQLSAIYKDLSPGFARDKLTHHIFEMCGRVVLNVQWGQLDDDEKVKKDFVSTVQSVHEHLKPLGYQKLELILNLMESQWTDPKLSEIMASEDDDIEGGIEYISNEDPEILKLRIEIMIKENCEEFALNLCEWSLKHPKLKGDLKIREYQISTLYKQQEYKKMQEVCSHVVCHDGIFLMSRLAKLSSNQDLCIRLAQVFLIQDWVNPDRNCCTQELLKLWIHHQYLADKDEERFLDSIWTVAKVCYSTEQIWVLIEGVRKECGDQFIQLYTELCKYALNIDKGNMEQEDGKGNKEEVDRRKKLIARTCVRMAFMLKDYDFRIARICGLTAFSLLPTTDNLNLVNKLYWTIKNTSVTSGNSKINPATIYELERLLGLMRPDILNPDFSWKQIIPVCKRYQLMNGTFVEEPEQKTSQKKSVNKPVSKPNILSSSKQTKMIPSTIQQTQNEKQKVNTSESPKSLHRVHAEHLLAKNKSLSNEKVSQLAKEKFPKGDSDLKEGPPLNAKELDKTINDLKKSINLNNKYSEDLSKKLSPLINQKEDSINSRNEINSNLQRNKGKTGAVSSNSATHTLPSKGQINILRPPGTANQECAKIAQQIAEMHEKQRKEREKAILNGKIDGLKFALNSRSIPSSSQISDLLSLTIKEKLNDPAHNVKSEKLDLTRKVTSEKTYSGNQRKKVVPGKNPESTPSSTASVTNTHKKPSTTQKFYVASEDVMKNYRQDQAGNITLGDSKVPIKPVFSMAVKKPLNEMSQDELKQTISNFVRSTTDAPSSQSVPSVVNKSGVTHGDRINKDTYTSHHQNTSQIPSTVQSAQHRSSAGMYGAVSSVQPVQETMVKTPVVMYTTASTLQQLPHPVMAAPVAISPVSITNANQSNSKQNVLMAVVNNGNYSNMPQNALPVVSTVPLNYDLPKSNQTQYQQISPSHVGVSQVNQPVLAQHQFATVQQFNSPVNQPIYETQTQMITGQPVIPSPSHIPVQQAMYGNMQIQALPLTPVTTQQVIHSQTLQTATGIPQQQTHNMSAQNLSVYNNLTAQQNPMQNPQNPMQNSYAITTLSNATPMQGADMGLQTAEALNNQTKQFAPPELSPAVFQQLLSSFKHSTSNKGRQTLNQAQGQNQRTENDMVNQNLTKEVIKHLTLNRNDETVKKSVIEATQKILQLRKQYGNVSQSTHVQGTVQENATASAMAVGVNQANRIMESQAIPELPDLGGEIDTILSLDNDVQVDNEKVIVENQAKGTDNGVIKVHSDADMIQQIEQILGPQKDVSTSEKHLNSRYNTCGQDKRSHQNYENSTYMNANRMAVEKEMKHTQGIRRPSNKVDKRCHYCGHFFKESDHDQHLRMNLCQGYNKQKELERQNVATGMSDGSAEFSSSTNGQSVKNMNDQKSHINRSLESSRSDDTNTKDKFCFVYKCSGCNFLNSNEKISIKHVENCHNNVTGSPSKQSAKMLVLCQCIMCSELFVEMEIFHIHLNKCSHSKGVKGQSSLQNSSMVNSSIKQNQEKYTSKGNKSSICEVKNENVTKKPRDKKINNPKDMSSSRAQTCDKQLSGSPQQLQSGCNQEIEGQVVKNVKDEKCKASDANTGMKVEKEIIENKQYIDKENLKSSDSAFTDMVCMKDENDSKSGEVSDIQAREMKGTDNGNSNREVGKIEDFRENIRLFEVKEDMKEIQKNLDLKRKSENFYLEQFTEIELKRKALKESLDKERRGLLKNQSNDLIKCDSPIEFCQENVKDKPKLVTDGTLVCDKNKESYDRKDEKISERESISESVPRIRMEENDSETRMMDDVSESKKEDSVSKTRQNNKKRKAVESSSPHDNINRMYNFKRRRRGEVFDIRREKGLRAKRLIKQKKYLIDEMEPIAPDLKRGTDKKSDDETGKKQTKKIVPKNEREQDQACTMCSSKHKTFSLPKHYVEKHNIGFKHVAQSAKCDYCQLKVVKGDLMKLKKHVTACHSKQVLHQFVGGYDHSGRGKRKPKLDKSSPTKSVSEGKMQSSQVSPRKIEKLKKHLKALALRKKCAENLKRIAKEQSYGSELIANGSDHQDGELVLMDYSSESRTATDVNMSESTTEMTPDPEVNNSDVTGRRSARRSSRSSSQGSRSSMSAKVPCKTGVNMTRNVTDSSYVTESSTLEDDGGVSDEKDTRSRGKRRLSRRNSRCSDRKMSTDGHYSSDSSNDRASRFTRSTSSLPVSQRKSPRREKSGRNSTNSGSVQTKNGNQKGSKRTVLSDDDEITSSTDVSENYFIAKKIDNLEIGTENMVRSNCEEDYDPSNYSSEEEIGENEVGERQYSLRRRKQKSVYKEFESSDIDNDADTSDSDESSYVCSKTEGTESVDDSDWSQDREISVPNREKDIKDQRISVLIGPDDEFSDLNHPLKKDEKIFLNEALEKTESLPQNLTLDINPEESEVEKTNTTVLESDNEFAFLQNLSTKSEYNCTERSDHSMLAAFNSEFQKFTSKVKDISDHDSSESEGEIRPENTKSNTTVMEKEEIDLFDVPILPPRTNFAEAFQKFAKSDTDPRVNASRKQIVDGKVKPFVGARKKFTGKNLFQDKKAMVCLERLKQTQRPKTMNWKEQYGIVDCYVKLKKVGPETIDKYRNKDRKRCQDQIKTPKLPDYIIIDSESSSDSDSKHTQASRKSNVSYRQSTNEEPKGLVNKTSMSPNATLIQDVVVPQCIVSEMLQEVNRPSKADVNVTEEEPDFVWVENAESFAEPREAVTESLEGNAPADLYYEQNEDDDKDQEIVILTESSQDDIVWGTIVEDCIENNQNINNTDLGYSNIVLIVEENDDNTITPEIQLGDKEQTNTDISDNVSEVSNSNMEQVKTNDVLIGSSDSIVSGERNVSATEKPVLQYNETTNENKSSDATEKPVLQYNETTNENKSSDCESDDLQEIETKSSVSDDQFGTANVQQEKVDGNSSKGGEIGDGICLSDTDITKKDDSTISTSLDSHSSCDSSEEKNREKIEEGYTDSMLSDTIIDGDACENKTKEITSEDVICLEKKDDTPIGTTLDSDAAPDLTEDDNRQKDEQCNTESILSNTIISENLSESAEISSMEAKCSISFDSHTAPDIIEDGNCQIDESDTKSTPSIQLNSHANVNVSENKNEEICLENATSVNEKENSQKDDLIDSKALDSYTAADILDDQIRQKVVDNDDNSTPAKSLDEEMVQEVQDSPTSTPVSSILEREGQPMSSDIITGNVGVMNKDPSEEDCDNEIPSSSQDVQKCVVEADIHSEVISDVEFILDSIIKKVVENFEIFSHCDVESAESSDSLNLNESDKESLKVREMESVCSKDEVLRQNLDHSNVPSNIRQFETQQNISVSNDSIDEDKVKSTSQTTGHSLPVETSEEDANCLSECKSQRPTPTDSLSGLYSEEVKEENPISTGNTGEKGYNILLLESNECDHLDSAKNTPIPQNSDITNCRFNDDIQTEKMDEVTNENLPNYSEKTDQTYLDKMDSSDVKMVELDDGESEDVENCETANIESEMKDVESFTKEFYAENDIVDDEGGEVKTLKSPSESAEDIVLPDELPNEINQPSCSTERTSSDIEIDTRNSAGIGTEKEDPNLQSIRENKCSGLTNDEEQNKIKVCDTTDEKPALSDNLLSESETTEPSLTTEISCIDVIAENTPADPVDEKSNDEEHTPLIETSCSKLSSCHGDDIAESNNFVNTEPDYDVVKSTVMSLVSAEYDSDEDEIGDKQNSEDAGLSIDFCNKNENTDTGESKSDVTEIGIMSSECVEKCFEYSQDIKFHEAGEFVEMSNEEDMKLVVSTVQEKVVSNEASCDVLCEYAEKMLPDIQTNSDPVKCDNETSINDSMVNNETETVQNLKTPVEVNSLQESCETRIEEATINTEATDKSEFSADPDLISTNKTNDIDDIEHEDENMTDVHMEPGVNVQIQLESTVIDRSNEPCGNGKEQNTSETLLEENNSLADEQSNNNSQSLSNIDDNSLDEDLQPPQSADVEGKDSDTQQVDTGPEISACSQIELQQGLSETVDEQISESCRLTSNDSDNKDVISENLEEPHISDGSEDEMNDQEDATEVKCNDPEDETKEENCEQEYETENECIDQEGETYDEFYDKVERTKSECNEHVGETRDRYNDQEGEIKGFNDQDNETQDEWNDQIGEIRDQSNDQEGEIKECNDQDNESQDEWKEPESENKDKCIEQGETKGEFEDDETEEKRYEKEVEIREQFDDNEGETRMECNDQECETKDVCNEQDGTKGEGNDNVTEEECNEQEAGTKEEINDNEGELENVCNDQECDTKDVSYEPEGETKDEYTESETKVEYTEQESKTNEECNEQGENKSECNDEIKDNCNGLKKCNEQICEPIDESYEQEVESKNACNEQDAESQDKCDIKKQSDLNRVASSTELVSGLQNYCDATDDGSMTVISEQNQESSNKHENATSAKLDLIVDDSQFALKDDHSSTQMIQQTDSQIPCTKMEETMHEQNIESDEPPVLSANDFLEGKIDTDINAQQDKDKVDISIEQNSGSENTSNQVPVDKPAVVLAIDLCEDRIDTDINRQQGKDKVDISIERNSGTENTSNQVPVDEPAVVLANDLCEDRIDTDLNGQQDKDKVDIMTEQNSSTQNTSNQVTVDEIAEDVTDASVGGSYELIVQDQSCHEDGISPSSDQDQLQPSSSNSDDKGTSNYEEVDSNYLRESCADVQAQTKIYEEMSESDIEEITLDIRTTCTSASSIKSSNEESKGDCDEDQQDVYKQDTTNDKVEVQQSHPENTDEDRYSESSDISLISQFDNEKIIQKSNENVPMRSSDRLSNSTTDEKLNTDQEREGTSSVSIHSGLEHHKVSEDEIVESNRNSIIEYVSVSEVILTTSSANEHDNDKPEILTNDYDNKADKAQSDSDIVSLISEEVPANSDWRVEADCSVENTSVAETDANKEKELHTSESPDQLSHVNTVQSSVDNDSGMNKGVPEGSKTDDVTDVPRRTRRKRERSSSTEDAGINRNKVVKQLVTRSDKKGTKTQDSGRQTSETEAKAETASGKKRKATENKTGENEVPVLRSTGKKSKDTPVNKNQFDRGKRNVRGVTSETPEEARIVKPVLDRSLSDKSALQKDLPVPREPETGVNIEDDKSREEMDEEEWFKRRAETVKKAMRKSAAAPYESDFNFESAGADTPQPETKPTTSTQECFDPMFVPIVRKVPRKPTTVKYESDFNLDSSNNEGQVPQGSGVSETMATRSRQNKDVPTQPLKSTVKSEVKTYVKDSKVDIFSPHIFTCDSVKKLRNQTTKQPCSSATVSPKLKVSYVNELRQTGQVKVGNRLSTRNSPKKCAGTSQYTQLKTLKAEPPVVKNEQNDVQPSTSSTVDKLSSKALVKRPNSQRKAGPKKSQNDSGIEVDKDDKTSDIKAAQPVSPKPDFRKKCANESVKVQKEQQSNTNNRKRTRTSSNVKTSESEPKSKVLKPDGTDKSPDLTKDELSVAQCKQKKCDSNCDKSSENRRSRTTSPKPLYDNKRTVRQIIHGGKIIEITKGSVTERMFKSTESKEKVTNAPSSSGSERSRSKRELKITRTRDQESPELNEATVIGQRKNLNEYIHKTLTEIKKKKEGETQNNWTMKKEKCLKSYKFPYAFKKSPRR